MVNFEFITKIFLKKNINKAYVFSFWYLKEILF